MTSSLMTRSTIRLAPSVTKMVPAATNFWVDVSKTCAPVAFAGNVSFRLSRMYASLGQGVSIVLATAFNGASHAMVSSALRSHDLHAAALETAGTGADPIFSDERVRPWGHGEQVRGTP